MPILLQKVSSYFDRYGWSYSEQKDNQTILTGFKGKNAYFKVAATLRSGWLSLVVLDYLPSVTPETQPSIYQYVLELNSQITFVRLVLTSENQIGIVADLPAESGLDYDLFAMAMDLLSYYADQLFPRLYAKINGDKPPLPEFKEDQ